MIVVDASALIECLLQTPTGLKVEGRLFAPRETLHAPHLLDLEIAQVLRRLAAAGAVTPGRCEEALQDLGDLAVHRYPHTPLMTRIWELRESVTAYDAAYLSLAEALDAPLLTCDAKLAASRGHRARVDVA
jgi:predicted nucleic acid-binding protein